MSAPVVKLNNQIMVRLDDDLLASLTAYAEAYESTVAATFRLAARRFIASEVQRNGKGGTK